MVRDIDDGDAVDSCAERGEIFHPGSRPHKSWEASAAAQNSVFQPCNVELTGPGMAQACMKLSIECSLKVD